MEYLKRSKLQRGLIIAGAIAAVLLLASWLALPMLVRVAIEREASARGLHVQLDGVDTGFSGITLRGAAFERDGGSIRGRVDEVTVEANLFALALKRVAAARDVRVRNLDLAISLAPAGERVPSDEGRAGGDVTARRLPPLRVDGATIRVSDEEGALGRVELTSAALDGARLVADLESMEVGAAPALVNAAEARIVADVETKKLSRVTIGSLDLSGLGREEEALALTRRIQRLRGGAAAHGSDDSAGADGTRFARLLDRLAADFELRVSRAVLPHQSSREAFVLEDTGFSRRSTSQFQVFGAGRGPSSSRAAFDVNVDAVEFRAGGSIEVENLPLDAIAGLVPVVPWHDPERGTLDADLRFEATSTTVIGFEGNVKVTALGIESPRIASEPVVGLDFSIAADGSWDVEERRLTVERGTFGLGKASVTFEGSATLVPEAWALSVRATLPRTACDEAVHAFPPAVLGGAAGFQLRGTLAGRLALSVDSTAPKDLSLDLHVDDNCRFVDWPAQADPIRFRSYFVHEALDPKREPFDFETGPNTEVWTPLEDVSPFLIAAVLAHEDASFFRHKGFSTFAIRGSLARNIAAGRFERGASTLTMQLAKNLFLNREKVLVRKLREVIFAWWLEKGFGKTATLELYLNVVEFGPFIYGVRNASLHYFGREPSELSPAEATFLATILPSPRTGGAQYERGELSRSTKNRVAALLRNMAQRELLSQEAADYGLAELESFRFHRRGEPPTPRTLPSTHPLFELDSRHRTQESMSTEGFDPWGFP